MPGLLAEREAGPQNGIIAPGECLNGGKSPNYVQRLNPRKVSVWPGTICGALLCHLAAVQLKAKIVGQMSVTEREKLWSRVVSCAEVVYRLWAIMGLSKPSWKALIGYSRMHLSERLSFRDLFLDHPWGWWRRPRHQSSLLSLQLPHLPLLFQEIRTKRPHPDCHSDWVIQSVANVWGISSSRRDSGVC